MLQRILSRLATGGFRCRGMVRFGTGLTVVGLAVVARLIVFGHRRRFFIQLGQ